MEDGLPKCSVKKGIISCKTIGSRGVVAALSKYILALMVFGSSVSVQRYKIYFYINSCMSLMSLDAMLLAVVSKLLSAMMRMMGSVLLALK